ncbi:DNA repair protein RecN [Thermincola ferriacetica]|uniref:DNA repair protein RecN n=1 Tax=Thermincola ferriacetica TaxID=281456 RepID=A0A0L6W5S9_9FIRM|nr:DNA repair protein RecN [Thermincola ferriacetica]KNZ70743.1 DNA repair protein RecN [Thermincola ferriacetica]
MIIRLIIKNFALIDNIELEISPGFNVLSGETGAGKSIIIDAMGVIIGSAGLHEYIRTGADKALIEALFDISGYRAVAAKLEDMGFASEDGTLLLTRELQRNGKNICRINGRTVTLSMYKEIGELLVDIYGQNYQQSLLRREKHLLLLDSFGGEAIKQKLEEISAVVEEYRRVRVALEGLQTDEADKARRLDMYNYQMREIDEAQLDPNEEERLLEERKVMANAEKLAELAVNAYNLLYLGDAPQLSALDLLHKALMSLRELVGIDSSMAHVAKQLEEALYQIEDCASEIGDYKNNLNFDPVLLNEIEDRLEKINKIKRKYGSTVADVLRYREEIAAAIEQITYADDEIQRLTEKLRELKVKYDTAAEKLSALRKAAAQKIEEEICLELADLNMPYVKFKVQFCEREEISAKGKDDVEFLLSPNPGEPLKPLAKIASGGETSRIMLAMKTILAKVDEVPTLIFDEIDAGLGGSAVQAVARKLAFIGGNCQVICVTHSPVTASFADTHFHILKEAGENKTVTKVFALNGEARINEIARMLGGANITPTTLKNAEEMLQHAQRIKGSTNRGK